MAIDLDRRLLTVAEYHRMGEVGILQETGLELINGEIIKMSPIGSRHASIVEKLKDLLTIELFKSALVRIQNPVVLSDYSEPEPDLAIVKYRKDYYRHAHPEPADIFILIEVAESSVEYDEQIKLPLYAQSGIAECWLVNVEKKQIRVCTEPLENRYGVQKNFKIPDKVSVSGFDFKLSLEEIFT